MKKTLRFIFCDLLNLHLKIFVKFDKECYSEAECAFCGNFKRSYHWMK